VSASFRLTAGVRQGGVLSVPLFTFFVNILLTNLDSHGCQLFGLNLGSLMYAYDLILLSPSIAALQAMVNIVCLTLDGLDLKLNAKKSYCIRIGKHYHADYLLTYLTAAPLRVGIDHVV